MKKQCRVLGVALLAVLLTAVVSQGETKAQVDLGAWLSGVTIYTSSENFYDSGSYAQSGPFFDSDPALTGFETSVEDVLQEKDAITSADASFGGGSGSASTSFGDVVVQAVATSAPSNGYAFAQQWYHFQGSDVGIEGLAVGYGVGVDLFADPGEFAAGEATLVVELYDWALGAYAWPEDSVGFSVDGALTYTEGAIPVDYGFLADNWYSIWLQGEAKANTGIIPAPGALLLGSIGVGFAGYLRRRRAL